MQIGSAVYWDTPTMVTDLVYTIWEVWERNYLDIFIDIDRAFSKRKCVGSKATSLETRKWQNKQQLIEIYFTVLQTNRSPEWFAKSSIFEEATFLVIICDVFSSSDDLCAVDCAVMGSYQWQRFLIQSTERNVEMDGIVLIAETRHQKPWLNFLKFKIRRLSLKETKQHRCPNVLMSIGHGTELLLSFGESRIICSPNLLKRIRCIFDKPQSRASIRNGRSRASRR